MSEEVSLKLGYIEGIFSLSKIISFLCFPFVILQKPFRSFLFCE